MKKNIRGRSSYSTKTTWLDLRRELKNVYKSRDMNMKILRKKRIVWNSKI